MKRGRESTGANTEPMPFIRRFGSGDGPMPEEPSPPPQPAAPPTSTASIRPLGSFRANSPPPQRTVPPELTAKLPPSLRGQGVAMTLLAKPQADPTQLLKSGDAAKADAEARERRRKSRWSTTKQFVPGMPTILPSNLTDEERKGYLLQLEIEEATRKLRLGEWSTDDADRSPSPEPVYDTNGKRLNTRDVRKRQELEQLRHESIQALIKINPLYKPPADYRPPAIRLHDKVYIPQEDHPEINFVGLLIGPRGNTLKALEQETQAKIIIRGKGSVKEGKLGRRDGPMPGESEQLHAFITGQDRETIERACKRINDIINAALSIPDGQNELRKLQLRELAVLNGTLRPEDILNATRCSNCGSDQHKSWECPEQQNVTANIICSICGGAGHIARDCKGPRTGGYYDGGAALDDEYAALMAELGQAPSKPTAAGNAQQLMPPPAPPSQISWQTATAQPDMSAWQTAGYDMSWATAAPAVDGLNEFLLAPPPPPPPPPAQDS